MDIVYSWMQFEASYGLKNPLATQTLEQAV